MKARSDSSNASGYPWRRPKGAERTTVSLIRYFLDFPQATPLEASKVLGMSFQNVYRLVSELKAANLLRASNFRRTSARGPQAQLITLRPDLGCTVGVDLEATHIRGVILDFAGQDVQVLRQPLTPTHGPEQVVAAVSEMARTLAADAHHLGLPIHAAGLGLPGPVIDSKKGRVHSPFQFGEATLEFASAVEQACGVRPSSHRNAEAFALGHHRTHRAGRMGIELILLNRFGLGSAMIWDGRLFTGASPYEGELGHLHCTVGGQRKRFHAVCTGAALLDLAQARGDSRSAQELLAAPDDPTVQAWLEQALPGFAEAIYVAVVLFSPDWVMLEGIFNALPSHVRERLLELTTQEMRNLGLEPPQIDFYASDDLMGARGAAFLARDEVADSLLTELLRHVKPSRPAASALAIDADETR